MKQIVKTFASIILSIIICAFTSNVFKPGDIVYAKGGAGAFTQQAYEEMLNYVANDDINGFKRLLFTDKALTLGYNDKYMVIETTHKYTIVQDHAGREMYVPNDLLSKSPFSKK